MAPKPANIYSETPAQGKAGTENIVHRHTLSTDQHIVDEWRPRHQIY